MLILRKAEAETKEIEPVVGNVGVTMRHPTVPRIDVPAAATEHTARAS